MISDYFRDAKFEKETFSCVVFQGDHNGLNMLLIWAIRFKSLARFVLISLK